MKKEKFKNPNIICAITYSIITVAYTVLTCIRIYQGEIVSAMLFACLTAVWGVLAGMWLHSAIAYKRRASLEKQRHFLICKVIELLDRLYEIEKKEDLSNER